MGWERNLATSHDHWNYGFIGIWIRASLILERKLLAFISSIQSLACA
jgi:hypothetical protein